MEDLQIERSQDAGTGKQTLKVFGKLTIEQAARFRDALLAALSGAQELELDVSGATAVDVSALQLLCACQQTADRQGKRFLVRHAGNELFDRVTAEAGFGQGNFGLQILNF